MLHMHGIYLPPLISFDSTDDVCIEIAKRFAYEQPMTLVNLFGALVGDYALSLMGNDRLSEQWSRIIPAIQKGRIPLPLCAAAFEIPGSQHGWFEMSPLQCGSKTLGYIPVQYLGSTFYNGQLQTDGLCPEYPLSFFLGMYGSAFAVTIQDIARIQKALHKKITILKENDQLFESDSQRNILQNHILQNIVQATIKEITMERNALAYAHFPNYSHGVHGSVLQQQEHVGLFDAGIAFDLPLPLLLDRPERNLDVIFLYGSFPGQKNCLQALEKYCHGQGMNFPDLSMIDDNDIKTEDMTILNDPSGFGYDVTIPTYIYFPTNDINLFATPYFTLNFRYTAHEVAQLSDKMEQVFLDNIDEVKRVLKMVAQKRYGGL